MNKKIEKYQDINGNVYQLTTKLEKVILNDLIKETESVVELSDENIKLKNKIDKAINILEKRINKIENQEWKSYTGQTDEEYLQEQQKLLDILKGDNK